MNVRLLPIRTEVECVEHNGAHVGIIVHLFDGIGYGIKWNDIIDGRAPRDWPHGRDVVLCDADRVVKQRRCCSICTKPAVETEKLVPSGSRFTVRCDAGHETNGIDSQERRDYMRSIAAELLGRK